MRRTRADRIALFSAAFATIAGLSAAGVEAEEPSIPRLRGEVLIEIQSDSDLDGQHANQYLTLESALSIDLSENLSIESGFVLEPVSGPHPGGTRWFDDEGLYVETLFLRWARGPFSLHAGKFNPAFGVAWAVARGIHGVDFAEDYEITERIGFGGSVAFGGGSSGRHRVGADAFFVDTSPLSRSLVHDRGRTLRSDRIPSNTLAPQSFSLTLQGGEFSRLPGLTYNLGFANQHRADAGGRTERDLVAGFAYGFSPFERLEIELLSEYAHLHNASGEAERRHYFTQSAAAEWAGWNIALSYTGRWIQHRGEAHRRDDLFQVSAGYAWEVGADARFGVVGADLGWCRVREAGLHRDGFSGLVSYAFAF